MQRESLWRHLDTAHNKRVERYLCCKVAPTASFQMRVVKGRQTGCPVPRCGSGAHDPYGMRRHFAFRHPQVVMAVEGEELTTGCAECGMFAVNMTNHCMSATCQQLRR